MARPQKVLELKASESSPASLAAFPDDELLELVQRQTFRFFWEGSHPVSGLAPDSCPARKDHVADLVAIGGSGFGVMALIVAVERDWVTREAALDRLERMLDLLTRATCYHGVFPHFMNGCTGATIRSKRLCGIESTGCGKTWSGTGTREAAASCSTGTGVPTMAGLWITRSTAGTSAWSPTF